MSELDEVKRMQQEGLSEEEIIKNLREKGIPYKNISEALSQTKIKTAVEEPASEPKVPAPTAQQTPQAEIPIPDSKQQLTQIQTTGQTIKPATKEIPGMQESIMQSQPQQPTQEYLGTPTPTSETPEYSPIPSSQEYPTEEYAPQYPGYPQQELGYSEYEYQPAGISSDTITEISEQVVSEKMSDMRKHLEKVLDFKTTVESKIESVDERLKRIEKIIGSLQSSVLRKVGDYVINIEDMKKELIETQKSFTKLLPEMKRQIHKPVHHTTHKTPTRKRTRKKK
ncbi:MAG: hypothetical protein IIA87_00400 [Nanoarchaeota archaeon]|nr:hypothetical protein [Nanoarchaeota archaeon]